MELKFLQVSRRLKTDDDITCISFEHEAFYSTGFEPVCCQSRYTIYGVSSTCLPLLYISWTFFTVIALGHRLNNPSVLKPAAQRMIVINNDNDNNNNSSFLYTGNAFQDRRPSQSALRIYILLPQSSNSGLPAHNVCTFSTPWGAFQPGVIFTSAHLLIEPH